MVLKNSNLKSEKLEIEYDFEYFLILCPIYYLTTSESSSKESKRVKRSVNNNNNNDNNSIDDSGIERYYLHPEDEIFEKNAIQSFVYHITKQTSNDELTYRPLLEGRLVREERLLLVIPHSHISKIISQLRKF